MKTILEGSRKEQARFLREIKLLRTMHTQHITRYMGWSVCPEGFVLLMEYMPGTLSALAACSFCIWLLIGIYLLRRADFWKCKTVPQCLVIHSPQPQSSRRNKDSCHAKQCQEMMSRSDLDLSLTSASAVACQYRVAANETLLSRYFKTVFIGCRWDLVRCASV